MQILYLFVSQIEFTQVKQQVSSSFETNYTDNSSYPDDWLKCYFLMQSWKSIYPYKQLLHKVSYNFP